MITTLFCLFVLFFCVHDEIGVSSVFYFVAVLSIVQLLICCVAEYQRLKQPSVLGALRLTTQKLLYFVVFMAALLRGAYFTTPVSAFFLHLFLFRTHARGAKCGIRQCSSASALYHWIWTMRNSITSEYFSFLFVRFPFRSTGSTTTGLGFNFDIGILSITFNMLIACRLLVGRGESYRNHVICFHWPSVGIFVRLRRS